jgi:hypothetical protein
MPGSFRAGSRAGIYANPEKLYRQQSASYGSLTRRGNGLFAMKRQPPKEQLVLVLLKSAGEAGEAVRSERVVVEDIVADRQ